MMGSCRTFEIVELLQFVLQSLADVLQFANRSFEFVDMSCQFVLLLSEEFHFANETSFCLLKAFVLFRKAIDFGSQIAKRRDTSTSNGQTDKSNDRNNVLWKLSQPTGQG